MMKKIQIKKRMPRICVISFPQPTTIYGNIFLNNLIKILESICEKVYVITSNLPKEKTFRKVVEIKDVKTIMHFMDTIHPMWWSTILQFFKIFIIQIKMCWILIKISKKIDVVFFYVGGSNLFIPTLTAKLLKKKVITSAIGLGSISYRYDNKKSFCLLNIFSTILSILERTIFFLSDLIVVESKSATEFLKLEKYKQKIVNTGARYINTKIFKIKKELKERENFVGYIGRLEEGKGVINFIKAIPLILEKQDNIRFFIGGNGPLYDRINYELRSNNLSEKVEIIGWIPHEIIADHLNDLKLLVLPSYSEGLPTIILEAMACGTPVLATPVGGIPDIINDGETGFILKDNSSECIVNNIERALEHPNLEEISKKARTLIENEFTYECAVNRYKRILKE